MKRPSPCLACGACCAALRVSFHHAELASQGGAVPDGMTAADGPRSCRMLGTDQAPPRCVALRGSVGETVRCSIYAERPGPCRDFQPHGLYGVPNPGCNDARARHGLPPIDLATAAVTDQA